MGGIKSGDHRTGKKGNTTNNRGGKNTRFKEGNPGGPGRPKLPEVVKEVRKINRAEVEMMFFQCFNMRIEELEIIAHDPESTAMQIAFAKCVLHAAQKGSLIHLEAVLSRLLPPLPKNAEDNPLSPYQVLREQMAKHVQGKLES